MQIKDILSNTPITKGFLCNDKDYNKKIIEKIYKEGKEIKVIQILELTFKELFIIFRKKLNKTEDEEEFKEIKKKIEGSDLLDDNNNYKDMNEFIDHIREKDENVQEETEEYIDSIRDLC